MNYASYILYTLFFIILFISTFNVFSHVLFYSSQIISLMRIKEISSENRPRERLEKLGPSVLSDAELLAIILKTGSRNENVIDLSNRIISKFELSNLANCSLVQLQTHY